MGCLKIFRVNGKMLMASDRHADLKSGSQHFAAKKTTWTIYFQVRKIIGWYKKKVNIQIYITSGPILCFCFETLGKTIDNLFSFFSIYIFDRFYQLCGSGTGWISIHLDPWIRIRIQLYKLKGKAEFNQQMCVFFVGNYIF